MPSLSVSIVTYDSDLAWFNATLAALLAAIRHARQHGGLADETVTLIDNTNDQLDTTRLFAPHVKAEPALVVLAGHGNIGYGAAHNLALLQSKADFHLILNPDITLAEDALTQALTLFAVRPDAVCLSPSGTQPNGGFCALAKRRVTPGLLLTRAAAPVWFKRLRKRALDAYEYRGELGASPRSVVSASGAFMLVKVPAAQKIGGFDERFFLHFEDIDFSLRLHEHGNLLFAPQVKVVHAGGGAASKHLKHLLVNGARYFRKWGFGDPLLKIKIPK